MQSHNKPRITALELPSDMSADELIAYTKVELPPITPEMISGMKRLDSFGTTSERAASFIRGIVGVVAGIKPATLFTLLPEDSLDRNELFQAVLQVGLRPHNFTTPKQAEGWSVSRHRKLNAELVSAAIEMQAANSAGADPVSDTAERRIGTLLGYPATSTAYFLQRSKTLKEDGTYELPQLDPENLDGLSDYCGFILSPDAYEEELNAYSKPLKDAMRVLAPHTYAFLEQNRLKKEAKLNPPMQG